MNFTRSIERANPMPILAMFVLVQPLMYAADEHTWSPAAKLGVGVFGLCVFVGVKFALLDIAEWLAVRAANKCRRIESRAERAESRRARPARRRGRAG